MSEDKPSQTVFEAQRGKVVGRNVAIALGIICIILVAALGVVLFLAYAPSSNSLQTTYNNYVDNHHYTDEEYTQMQASLQAQISNLTSIIGLGNSSVWVNDQTLSQPAGSYNDWSPAFSASYCGYLVVQVLTSTTDKTYVRVSYSSHGVSYDNQTGVGSGGTATFPILPSSSIDVRIGNTNLVNGATETVTITYYY